MAAALLDHFCSFQKICKSMIILYDLIINHETHQQHKEVQHHIISLPRFNYKLGRFKTLKNIPYTELTVRLQCVPCNFKGFLNGPNQASFLFIFGLFKQTSLQFLQPINVKNVMSIQYTVPGFEPTTFGDSSHNNQTSGQSYKHIYDRNLQLQSRNIGNSLVTMPLES